MSHNQEPCLQLSIRYTDAISMIYGQLNSLEKGIADFLLQNGINCQHMSVNEVADACRCSGATVVRFARRLGYDGFADLRYHIRNAHSGNRTDDISLTSRETPNSMKQKALMYATQSLQATVGDTQDDALDLAARALLNADSVQLVAMGSASGVALGACSQFLSFGIRASCLTDELQQLRSAACMKKGDVLIGINYNNAAKNVADAFMAAKKAGATTVLITAVRSGILSRYADLVFYTPTRRPNNALNISTTTLCQSMILQLLILRMWQLAPERFEAETQRIRSYTRMKLYDPSMDKVSVDYSKQSQEMFKPS